MSLLILFNNESVYELPTNRQWVLNGVNQWVEVVEVYVLDNGEWKPDKVIKIDESGVWV